MTLVLAVLIIPELVTQVVLTVVRDIIVPAVHRGRLVLRAHIVTQRIAVLAQHVL